MAKRVVQRSSANTTSNENDSNTSSTIASFGEMESINKKKAPKTKPKMDFSVGLKT